ncbi:MAG: hypothetical protein CL923_01285 [Deltaproteobacteria bacterium]|nr:hypothetical protein [Deltaproteobacteria bacterium]
MHLPPERTSLAKGDQGNGTTPTKRIREVAVPLTQVIHGQTWRLIGGLTILGVVFKLADVFLQ